MKMISCLKVSLLALSMSAIYSVSAQAAETDSAALIKRGEQIAVASDCQACHTAPGSKTKFSGGYGIASPMGVIYSTNITPSAAGIGNYSEAEFAAAVREGVRKDGAHLYPAMPYTSYHLITDEDMHALYTYFMHAVPAVDQENKETKLPFPFNLRFSMKFWNMLYGDTAQFKADPTKSAEWNRGNYLVNGLAHCGTCHTPRNFMMAENSSKAFAGAAVGGWFAPNITSDKISGIGGWSDDELVTYLKTGRAIGKNQAAGGMAEAVENSLQYLPDSDLKAIVTYLKQTKPLPTEGETQPAWTYGQPVDVEDEVRGKAPNNANDSLKSGAALFSGNCASCHQPNGAGSKNQAYPSLFHNTATGMINPNNLIAAILYGVKRDTADHQVLMPGFSSPSYVDQLNDQQIADISNYVLHNYGNPAVKVTAGDVAWARKGGKPPMLARMQPYIIPGIALVVVIGILALAATRLRRSRKMHKQ